MNYDPGADLATRYPLWVWRRVDLCGVAEVLSRSKQVILTDRGLDRTGSRCTLAHAVAHLDLDHHAIFDGKSEMQEEREADKVAARRLVALGDLVDALSEDRDHPATADILRVTPAVLTFRLEHLHPAERGYLQVRASAREHCA